MRRTILLTAIAAVVAASAALAKSFPATIALPTGFQPEGIAEGDGPTFFVGSIPTGAVFRGDLRTGEGEVLVPGRPVARRSGSRSTGAGLRRRRADGEGMGL